MLAIRMQRTGRKGNAQFRVVVQDSRRTPTSGNVVALVGSYDPHAKVANIDKDKVSFYLSNGAQPSPRVIKILQQEKVKLPNWVELPKKRTSKTKNIEKLRRNRPPEEKKPVEEAPVSEEAEAVVDEAVVESADEPAETEVSEEKAENEAEEEAEVEAAVEEEQVTEDAAEVETTDDKPAE